MNAGQHARRQELLAEVHSSLGETVETTDSGFLANMGKLASRLEDLAIEVDETSADRLERARGWRLLGNAFTLLGASGNSEALEKARAALDRAQALLEGMEIPSEKMKLAYSQGYLLHLQSSFEKARRACVGEAARKYAEALEAAQAERRAPTEPIARALSLAKREIELLDRLNRVIDAAAPLTARHRTPAEGSSSWETTEAMDFEVLERLLQACDELGKFQAMRIRCVTQIEKELLWL